VEGKKSRGLGQLIQQIQKLRRRTPRRTSKSRERGGARKTEVRDKITVEVRELDLGHREMLTGFAVESTTETHEKTVRENQAVPKRRERGRGGKNKYVN